jgi:hypothetical protein
VLPTQHKNSHIASITSRVREQEAWTANKLMDALVPTEPCYFEFQVDNQLQINSIIIPQQIGSTVLIEINKIYPIIKHFPWPGMTQQGMLGQLGKSTDWHISKTVSIVPQLNFCGSIQASLLTPPCPESWPCTGNRTGSVDITTRNQIYFQWLPNTGKKAHLPAKASA